MQVVWTAFSGMLWLQSWDNYSHPTVCLAPTMPTPEVACLPIQVHQVRLLCTAAQAGLPCSCAQLS